MDNRLLQLADGDLLELPDARGTTLHVAQGRVWVTQEGDRRDIVLRAGDTWTLELPGLTVAEAQGGAKVMLFQNGPRNTDRERKAGLEERFTRWFERTARQHLRMGWHM